MNSQPENLAIAKIYPSKILTEECFDIVIAPGQAQITECVAYQGNISVEIPYDGYKFFTHDAIQKLKKSEATRAQLGWLAISNPIDWKSSWERDHGVSELVSLSIPIRGENIQPEDWDADTKLALLSYKYMEGQHFPLTTVSLNAEISDSILVDEETLKVSDLRNMKEDEIIRKVLSKAKPELRIRKNESLDNKNVEFEFIESGEMLVVRIEIKLRVPISLGSGNEINVHIDQMELNWPTIVTQQGLNVIRDIQIDNSIYWVRQDWRYCPDNLSIEMDIPKLIYVTQRQTQSQPFNDYLLNLYLLVRASEGLIKQDNLHGQMSIIVENILLSGRDIAWIDATGKRKKNLPENTKVSKRSVFNVNFDITLSELFDKRQTLITHQWYFPGVYLNANRLADLQGVLKDVGYEIINPEIGYEPDITQSKEGAEKDTGKFLLAKVTGRRYHITPREKIRTMDVELWAIKTSATTTMREREIESQGVYKSSIPTSDLVIIFLGKIDGAAEVLSRDAQKIVTKLKKRLKSVADAR